MKKMNRIVACLVVGVLVLSVSAFAAFGSVGGYGQYKDAIKLLLLETKSLSLEGSATITVDGETIGAYAFDGQYDNASGAYRSHNVRTLGDRTEENWSSDVDGRYVSFNSRQPTYYHTWDTETATTNGDVNLLGFSSDDEMGQRVVRFVELAADTVMGDLKNNFVQIGSDGGSRTYTVDISEKQVPALVNAGLSLMAGSIGYDPNYARVEYEDEQKTYTDYYEKATGETISPEMAVWLYGEQAELGVTYEQAEDWYEKDAGAIDRYYEVTGELSMQYWDEADAHDRGVLYVHTDGSTDYYPTSEAFYTAHPINDVANDWDYLMGQDAALEHVTSTFTADPNGRMTHNETSVSFSTRDGAGKDHEIVVSVELDLWDYDTTTVQAWDPGDRIKLD